MDIIHIQEVHLLDLQQALSMLCFFLLLEVGFLFLKLNVVEYVIYFSIN